MDILIGLAFIIKVCFKRFIKVYAYGILPYILLVSVLNIYHSIKNKDYKSYRIFNDFHSDLNFIKGMCMTHFLFLIVYKRSSNMLLQRFLIEVSVEVYCIVCIDQYFRIDLSYVIDNVS